MKPIRVLCIMFSAMNTGGAETMLMNYFRTMDRTKVTFDFLCNGIAPGAYDEEIAALGGVIYWVPAIGANPVEYMAKSYKIISNYSIVHVHQDVLGAIPLFLAKVAGVPVRIVHSHSTKFIEAKGIKSKLLQCLKTAIPKLATERMACGEEAGKALFGTYPFTVLPNAIDVDEFARKESVRNRIRGNMKVAADDIVIGQVGRFVEVKNHRFLLEIIKEMYTNSKNIQLWLFGDGPLQEEIQKLAATLEIADIVHFMGVHQNVNEYMQAMDAFVFPSLWEGFPVVLVEAQAAGLPCIISNRCSEKAIVTKGAISLPLEDGPAKWSKAIFLQLENGQHEGIEERKKELAKAHLDVSAEAEILERYYIDLLAAYKIV